MKLSGVKQQLKVKKSIKTYVPTVSSKNISKSHKPLKAVKNAEGKLESVLGRFEKRVIVRFGTTNQLNKDFDVVINTIDSIRNSSNKLISKRQFLNANIPTPEAWSPTAVNNTLITVGNNPETQKVTDLEYPLIAKLRLGSQGKGLILLESAEEVTEFLTNFNEYCNLLELPTTVLKSSYIFEKYYNYSREYRIHISRNGVVYTNRKMLKKDTDDSQRFFRNDVNCIWFTESNPGFDKPVNWDDIVQSCKDALNAVGLDIGAVDVRVQGTMFKNKKRKSPKFQILEINSAPSFGEGTLKAYTKELPKLIKQKITELG